MNRLTRYQDLDELFEPEPAVDFYEIETTACDYFVVSAATARAVERTLARRLRRRWVAFRDLAGSRHRLLRGQIYKISESTAAQRAARRAFYRARRLEAKADRRPWEDD